MKDVKFRFRINDPAGSDSLRIIESIGFIFESPTQMRIWYRAGEDKMIFNESFGAHNVELLSEMPSPSPVTWEELKQEADTYSDKKIEELHPTLVGANDLMWLHHKTAYTMEYLSTRYPLHPPMESPAPLSWPDVLKEINYKIELRRKDDTITIDATFEQLLIGATFVWMLDNGFSREDIVSVSSSAIYPTGDKWIKVEDFNPDVLPKRTKKEWRSDTMLLTAGNRWCEGHWSYTACRWESTNGFRVQPTHYQIIELPNSPKN